MFFGVHRVVKDTFCGVFMCHGVDESMDGDHRLRTKLERLLIALLAVI